MYTIVGHNRTPKSQQKALRSILVVPESNLNLFRTLTHSTSTHTHARAHTQPLKTYTHAQAQACTHTHADSGSRCHSATDVGTSKYSGSNFAVPFCFELTEGGALILVLSGHSPAVTRAGAPSLCCDLATQPWRVDSSHTNRLLFGLHMQLALAPRPRALSTQR